MLVNAILAIYPKFGIEFHTPDTILQAKLTHLVAENESMHPTVEFTHQIKVCYYLKAYKAD